MVLRRYLVRQQISRGAGQDKQYEYRAGARALEEVPMVQLGRLIYKVMNREEDPRSIQALVARRVLKQASAQDEVPSTADE